MGVVGPPGAGRHPWMPGGSMGASEGSIGAGGRSMGSGGRSMGALGVCEVPPGGSVGVVPGVPWVVVGVPAVPLPPPQSFLAGLSPHHDSWIGLHDRGTEGTFQWVDGTPLSYRWVWGVGSWGGHGGPCGAWGQLWGGVEGARKDVRGAMGLWGGRSGLGGDYGRAMGWGAMGEVMGGLGRSGGGHGLGVACGGHGVLWDGGGGYRVGGAGGFWGHYGEAVGSMGVWG